MAALLNAPLEETKHARFYRIMEPRITKALQAINMVAYGADTTRYETDPAEVDLLEETLYRTVNQVIGAYRATNQRAYPVFQFERLLGHDAKEDAELLGLPLPKRHHSPTR